MHHTTWCICNRGRVLGHLAYAAHMVLRMASRAKDTHMTNRVVRVDDDDWAEYELACRDKGLSRAADMRMHIKRENAAYRRRQRES